MGLYSEYLDNPSLRTDFNALTAERKKQLKRISRLRENHDILVFAADFGKGPLGGQTAISYPDILPITDQLSNLKGKHLDLVLAGVYKISADFGASHSWGRRCT